MTDITTCRSHIDCRPENNQATQKLSDFIKKVFAKLEETRAQRRQHKIDRDAFRNLMSLDKASLKDIGVSRDDIIWASKLAMHENASKELEKIRALNIANARINATTSFPRRKL